LFIPSNPPPLLFPSPLRLGALARGSSSPILPALFPQNRRSAIRSRQPPSLPRAFQEIAQNALIPLFRSNLHAFQNHQKCSKMLEFQPVPFFIYGADFLFPTNSQIQTRFRRIIPTSPTRTPQIASVAGNSISALSPIEPKPAPNARPRPFSPHRRFKITKKRPEMSPQAPHHPPLGRPRAATNGQSPLQAALPSDGLPTPRRDAPGPTPPRCAESLGPQLRPQNTTTPTATQEAASPVCPVQSLFCAKGCSRFHGRVVESLRGQSVKGLLISPTQMEGDA
jgi:hypothetical protein